MLRAAYDQNGNIILRGQMFPSAPPMEEIPMHAESEAKSWNFTEEEIVPKPVASLPPLSVEKPKISIIHNVGTQVKKIMRTSVQEGERQLRTTAHDAESGMKDIRQSLTSVPKKITAGLTSFWRLAQSPVSLPTRKPGRRPRKKITLFLIDTVRFGGTFGFIFAVLFIGMNYQSFWQIASAELALGNDMKTEQGLADITKGSSSVKAFGAMQTTGNTNILAYLPAVGPYEDRLIIPKLGENVPIVRPSMEALMKEDWKQFEIDIQTALHDGVVHYPGSARPGQAGNVFITGHSSYFPWDKGEYKDVFARLSELEPGDTYTIYYGGDRHTYRVEKKYEVKPSDVSVLDQPTNERISTLMTCTPVGTTLRRLIVKAVEIDPFTGEILLVGEKRADSKETPLTRLEALPI